MRAVIVVVGAVMVEGSWGWGEARVGVVRRRRGRRRGREVVGWVGMLTEGLARGCCG